MSDSFSYISFGNHQYAAGVTGPFEMGRGRMFEYTPLDIEKRLEELSTTAISYLERLPAFLCSEISTAGSTISMIVKYGRVESIKPNRKEVAANFKPIIDFGVVEFSDVEQAQDIFSAERFQLYRTHWAVRQGDVQQILTRLRQLKPDQPIPVGEPPEPGLDAAEPPPRAKNTIGKAESVEAFLKLLYGGAPSENTETFFRGHSNSTYELTPSLLRKWPNGVWQFMPSEERLCKELLIAHYDEFQSDQYCFDRLVRMQHYGLPTRLLDISSNPLVALFFACQGTTGKVEAEGEVIIFRIKSDNVKYYDSDTVSCIANLSNLTYAQKNGINLTLEVPAFNGTDVAQKLLHHIKSEKGYFEGRIMPDDLGSIICVKAKRTNTRIKSQSGAFLLFGHEATLPETGNEGIEISRVTIINKTGILNELSSININATTVYPSIDQTTVHLRKRYEAPNTKVE